MKSTMQKISDESIELLITIPWSEVAEAYEQIIEETVKNAEISGFRKGKAPRAVVEKSLDKTKTYEEVVRHIVPDTYAKAVKEHNLHPIVMPKIELKEATEQKDWIIRAITCEKPTGKLLDYKIKIKELKNSKLQKIWVPGKDQKDDKETKESQKPTLDDILKALFESVSIHIPTLLLEQETNRLLSDFIDQTKKIGLSVDQYLASTHKNADDLKREYTEEAKRTVTLEFALEAVADSESIFITDDEIEKAINTAKDDKEKEALSKERYYLASILRRQKTLDFLAAL